MKGLVKFARGKGNMEVREVVERPLEAGELRIGVEAAGICGSDLHIYHDEIKIPIRVPVVLGHEFSGRVVEIGRHDELVARPNGSYARLHQMQLLETRPDAKEPKAERLKTESVL